MINGGRVGFLRQPENGTNLSCWKNQKYKKKNRKKTDKSHLSEGSYEAPDSQIPDRRLNAGLIADDMFPPPNPLPLSWKMARKSGGGESTGSRKAKENFAVDNNEDNADKLQ